MDKDFGIRRDDDGTFKIGNSTLKIDPNSGIHVEGKRYEGTKGLFEFLTLKKVKRKVI